MTNTKSDTSTKDTNFIKIVLQTQTFGPVFLLLCCELVMFSGRDWKRVWFMKQKYISENINVSCRQFHRHFRQLVCNALLNIVMKLLAKTSRIISREFREKNWFKPKISVFILGWLESSLLQENLESPSSYFVSLYW